MDRSLPESPRDQEIVDYLVEQNKKLGKEIDNLQGEFDTLRAMLKWQDLS